MVMNYVFGKSGGDGGTPRDDAWLNFFDVVITGRFASTFTVSVQSCLAIIQQPYTLQSHMLAFYVILTHPFDVPGAKTTSAKPNFFVDGNRSPLFEVDISTGMLRNTDNGTPLIQVNIRDASL